MEFLQIDAFLVPYVLVAVVNFKYRLICKGEHVPVLVHHLLAPSTCFLYLARGKKWYRKEFSFTKPQLVTVFVNGGLTEDDIPLHERPLDLRQTPCFILLLELRNVVDKFKRDALSC